MRWYFTDFELYFKKDMYSKYQDFADYDRKLDTIIKMRMPLALYAFFTVLNHGNILLRYEAGSLRTFKRSDYDAYSWNIISQRSLASNIAYWSIKELPKTLSINWAKDWTESYNGLKKLYFFSGDNSDVTVKLVVPRFALGMINLEGGMGAPKIPSEFILKLGIASYIIDHNAVSGQLYDKVKSLYYTNMPLLTQKYEEIQRALNLKL